MPDANSLTACEPWLPPRIRIDLALLASRPAKAAARSTRARRTGLPVKRTLRRANAAAASSNATNTRRAKRPRIRLVKPGRLFCSCIAVG